MELVLKKHDSIISGRATYFFNNGKFYKTFNVAGNISDDSIRISDEFIDDKFMPAFDCSYYGDYYLRIDSATASGIWKEPYKSIIRKLETADIFLVQDQIPKSNFDSLLLINTTAKRYDTVIQTFKTDFKTIVVSISDDAVVDNDIISVMLDEKILIKKYSLRAEPFNLTLSIDGGKKKSCLKFIAENEGRIPPNTASIKIRIGQEVHSFIIPSSFKYNGVVVFELNQ